MLEQGDKQIIEQLAILGKQTAAKILPFYGKPQLLNTQRKSNDTPFTIADMMAHSYLSEQLPKIINIPVVSEESESKQCVDFKDYWLIDPIDGTREFISQTDEFCIIITRIIDGRPQLAFIYAPISDTYWYAIKGKGSYKKFPLRYEPKRLRCRNIKATPNIITSRRHNTNYIEPFTTQFFPDYRLMHLGSALKFCMIAEGKADFYPKFNASTSQWDIAAGDLLLQEAGGNVRFIDDCQPTYGVNRPKINPPFLAYGANFDKVNLTKTLSLMKKISHAKKAPQKMPHIRKNGAKNNKKYNKN